MAINVTANDIHDAAHQLGLRAPSAEIRIQWRRGPDFGHGERLPGCIVDATSVPGEETKRAFQTSAQALRYIAAMLKKHDEAVKEMAQKRANETRLAVAMAKKKCCK